MEAATQKCDEYLKVLYSHEEGATFQKIEEMYEDQDNIQTQEKEL